MTKNLQFNIKTRSEQLQEEIERLQHELANLQLPVEPEEQSVIAFTKRYGGKTLYHFAGIRVANGWHITGRHNDNAMTWNEVLDFVIKAENLAECDPFDELFYNSPDEARPIREQ